MRITIDTDDILVRVQNALDQYVATDRYAVETADIEKQARQLEHLSVECRTAEAVVRMLMLIVPYEPETLIVPAPRLHILLDLNRRAADLETVHARLDLLLNIRRRQEWRKPTDG